MSLLDADPIRKPSGIPGLMEAWLTWQRIHWLPEEAPLADRRPRRFGLAPLYQMGGNPLPWLDEILNGVGRTNFFENRATECSRASTRGTREEAFDR